MLAKKIKYKNFHGEDVEKTFYFHFSKPEMMEMNFAQEGGMQAYFDRISNERDGRKILETFKELILKSVGDRSDDGERFVKTDEFATAFSQTNAYEVLYMELAGSADAGAEFLLGCMPADMRDNGEAKKAIEAAAAQRSGAGWTGLPNFEGSNPPPPPFIGDPPAAQR